jgi:hypothetical protein
MPAAHDGKWRGVPDRSWRGRFRRGRNCWYAITLFRTLARLVEPIIACLAGLDLVELLLQVSSGKSPAAAAEPGRHVHAFGHAILAWTWLAWRHTT